MCLIGAVLLQMENMDALAAEPGGLIGVDLSGWKMVLAESRYDSSHRLAFSRRENVLSEGGRSHGDRIQSRDEW